MSLAIFNKPQIFSKTHYPLNAKDNQPTCFQNLFQRSITQSNGLKLIFIKEHSKSVTSVRLWDWLYFWLYSNQMLITKVLFNVF